MSIQVHLDSPAIDAQLQIGTLTIEETRGKEIFNFEFTDEAINHPEIRTYLPNVSVGKGDFYISNSINEGLYKLLTDSMPDRWGRALLRKKQLQTSKEEGITQKLPNLKDSDYLLQVADQTRMGALRFYSTDHEDYLDSNKDPIPPITRARELQDICRRVENDEEIGEWLKLLIAPGTSLGGARPKANIMNDDGVLCIAKFPSNNDEIDVGLWEFITNRLAYKSGIDVPDYSTENFGSKYTTVLCPRFDRVKNSRIHFVSAMTLTQNNDGDEDVSYLDIVEVIRQHGSNVSSNLHELWRRIIFNIVISNGDDHLRNHGFVQIREGWTLSKAYDVNPDSGIPGFLRLNIDEDDNSANIDLALSVAEHFQLNKEKCNSILEGIKTGMSDWERFAKKYNASQNEIDLMNSVFQHRELDKYIN